MKYRYNTRYKPSRRPSKRQLLLAAVFGVGLIIAGGILFSINHAKDTAKTTPKVTVHHPAPVAEQPKQVTKRFGIAAGSSLAGLSDSELNNRLAGMQAMNAGWVRFDFDWSNIQPDSANSYSWNNYDRLVAASNSHNLKVLAILDFTPGWARPNGCDSSHCGPKDNAAYARFAAVAVNRYKGQGVTAWEIWNEPNSPDFWQPKADPAAYTDMLAQSFNAIHSADPTAVVITGGLSPQSTGDKSYAPVDFLKAVYQNGGKPYFDAVADHPYTFPLTPKSNHNQAWNQMAAARDSMRSVMIENGDSAKKIWITEFGSPTGGPGPVATLANPNLAAGPFVVDQPLQARILADAVELYKSYDWAGPFFYYSYMDAGTTNDTNENFFGLVTESGQHKQAYDVFKQSAASTE